MSKINVFKFSKLIAYLGIRNLNKLSTLNTLKYVLGISIAKGKPETEIYFYFLH